jgi:hypothetical protein
MLPCMCARACVCMYVYVYMYVHYMYVPIQWVPGALFLGVGRPGREADRSPPSVPKSRIRGAIPPIPQYVFMAWCLVKHRGNFTFTFILPPPMSRILE